MRMENMARELKGLQTVSTVSKLLDVDRRTAINYISLLRKKRFVKTTRGYKKTRMYEISETPIRKMGEDFYDFLNKFSKIKIAKPYEYIIHDHKLTPEECIVRAIETKDFRVILSSIYLFKFVKNWSDLYGFSKKSNSQKSVGALYDLSRMYIRVKRMDKRIRNKLLESKPVTKYIIPQMSSRDFKDIEKTWGIRLPFNKSDMERLK